MQIRTNTSPIGFAIAFSNIETTLKQHWHKVVSTLKQRRTNVTMLKIRRRNLFHFQRRINVISTLNHNDETTLIRRWNVGWDSFFFKWIHLQRCFDVAQRCENRRWKWQHCFDVVNVVQINFEISNVDVTFFNIVNFNVDVYSIVSTLIWRCATSQRHINLKTTLKQRWNVCWEDKWNYIETIWKLWVTQDNPQHDSLEVLNFQRFLSLVVLLKRILIKKIVSTKNHVDTLSFVHRMIVNLQHI